MRAILLRRLPLLLLTLFVSSVLIFVASEILPIDVARNILGQFAPQEAVDALNHKLGFDQPPVTRYAHWVGRALTGDFGMSTSQQSRVGPLVLKHAVNSGILALAALIIVFAVELNLLPGSSALLTESNVLQSPAKLVLPVLTLAIVDVGYVARMMRASMIEVMQSPYIRAARLRGLPFRR